MSGYASELVMAGGTFIDGSTSEISADGPLRETYVLSVQGGHHSHGCLALERALLAPCSPSSGLAAPLLPGRAEAACLRGAGIEQTAPI